MSNDQTPRPSEELTLRTDALIDIEPTDEFVMIPGDVPVGMFTSVSGALPPIDIAPNDEFEALARQYQPMSLISDLPLGPAGERQTTTEP